MAPIFAYWNIRAIGEPIRYLLHYAGVDFIDKRYVTDEWFQVKFNLGLDLPNLPYYIDGDLKLTHSLAIMRYLASKHNLLGEDERQSLRIDMMEQQCNDLRWNQIRLAFNVAFESLKEDYIRNLPVQLKQINDFLSSGPWTAGSKLTYVDFMLYETLEQHLYLDPNCLEGFDNLKGFYKAFESLPKMKEYFNMDRFKPWPLFANTAYFGNVQSPALPKPVVK